MRSRQFDLVALTMVTAQYAPEKLPPARAVIAGKPMQFFGSRMIEKGRAPGACHSTNG